MKKLLLTAVAVLTFFASCKEEETISRIEIAEGETIQMNVGEYKQLHVNHYPEHLQAPKYSWSSSDKNVAYVSISGGINATTEGETTIIVSTENGINAKCRIIVGIIAISEIKLDKPDYEIHMGESLQLKPTVSPSDATYANKLVYSTTDEKVVKIDNYGNLETVSIGECQIKITSPDGKVSTVCNLKVLPNEVTNISINNSELTIEQGEAFKFEVVFEPINATDKTVTWISSNDSIATIGNDGTLTGVGIGECTITANSSNEKVKAECKVKVNPASVKGLELNITNAKIVIGSTDAITATVIPSNAANKNVTWTSSDETIATVDNGTVTGIATGTVTITATTEDGGFKQTCEVTVGRINIFMSAQNGGVVTTFSGGGVTSSVKCEITNNSNVDVIIKECVVGGIHFTVGQTLYSSSNLKYECPAQSTSVVWIIEYDSVEYEVVSTYNSLYGLEDLLGL